MAKLSRAHRNERKLQRRAARARRSQWLGRLVFSLAGMGLFLVVRMNPEMLNDTVAYVQNHKNTAPQMITKPADIRVRTMPASAVPVRRGGNLPGHTRQIPRDSTQSQAETISAQLTNMAPGG